MIGLKLEVCSRRLAASLLKATTSQSQSAVVSQKRGAHESYHASGAGGRSSFSGVVATVFGGTGFVGHAVLNRLTKNGASIVLPHRGSFQHINRIKLMADLGQMLPRKFSLNDDDDRVRELIQYSNCVINLVGSNRPYLHYSLDEVNVQWPQRLAKLIAEKDDGTRLIQLSALNCNRKESQDVSNLMKMHHDTEVGMRRIYPETIVVRSANAYGMNDSYTNFFLNERFEKDLSLLGSIPLLYDAGKSTTIVPVYVGDLAEGIARISRHVDAPGQTFEIVGPRRYIMRDFVDYLYKVYKDKPYHPHNTLGPMDKKMATPAQSIVRYLLSLYFKRQTMPRLRPRAFDLMSRRNSPYDQWATEDYFNQIHITDIITGAPGLQELGINPTVFEDKAHIMWGGHLSFHRYEIPSIENYPDIKQQPNYIQRIADK